MRLIVNFHSEGYFFWNFILKLIESNCKVYVLIFLFHWKLFDHFLTFYFQYVSIQNITNKIWCHFRNEHSKTKPNNGISTMFFCIKVVHFSMKPPWNVVPLPKKPYYVLRKEEAYLSTKNLFLNSNNIAHHRAVMVQKIYPKNVCITKNQWMLEHFKKNAISPWPLPCICRRLPYQHVVPKHPSSNSKGISINVVSFFAITKSYVSMT